MRVDSRTDGRSADRQFANGSDRLFGSFDGKINLSGQAADLLSQPQWCRVHQMGAADFDDFVPGLCFLVQRFGQPAEVPESGLISIRCRQQHESRWGKCHWYFAPY